MFDNLPVFASTSIPARVSFTETQLRKLSYFMP